MWEKSRIAVPEKLAGQRDAISHSRKQYAEHVLSCIKEIRRSLDDKFEEAFSHKSYKRNLFKPKISNMKKGMRGRTEGK